MTSTYRRLLLGALLATSTTCATIGATMTAASAASVVGGHVLTGGGAVYLRTGPSTAAATAGTLASRTSISISCYVSGDTVTGYVRRTAQWDKLTSGRYVSHAYVQTTAPIPSC